LNLSKALTSTRGGILADKLGSGPLILFGWVSFGIAFLVLGWVENSLWLWTVTIVFGLTTGIAEGPERALISEFAAEDTRGTAFGWYHLMTGVAAIPAGLAFGLIWQFQSAAWAFRYAGALALVASLLLHLWAWPKRKKDL
jgi:MFS family permease